MKIYNLKCPQCFEIIEYEIDRDFMFCKYCGKKILKSEITLDSIISEKESKIDEAQEYYERWLSLREKRNSNASTEEDFKAFKDFDIEYKKKFCDDYRRLYCDVLTITKDFKGISIYTSEDEYRNSEGIDSYHARYCETYITCGGLKEKEYLISIVDKIKKFSDVQAKQMADRIQKHIDEVILVAEGQCIDKKRYIIKIEEKIQPKKKQMTLKQFFFS